MFLRIVFASIAAIALHSPAASAPWVMSGQQYIDANSAIDNPTPANTGAVGAVRHLPFVVGDGETVCINSYVMEGYDDSTGQQTKAGDPEGSGISVIFVWTGRMRDGLTDEEKSEFRKAHGLPSAAGDNGHGQITGMDYCFDSGTVINIRLINGQSYSGVYGWGVWGTIAAAP